MDYHVPSHIRLSEECRDLLKRVLVADPAKRITVDAIYNHAWYCKNLPPGVREMNDRPQPLPEGLQSVEEITKIVQVCVCGYWGYVSYGLGCHQLGRHYVIVIGTTATAAEDNCQAAMQLSIPTAVL